MNEQENDDVWILFDAGSTVAVCPSEFQEDICTKADATGPKCGAAAGTAVTLGGARVVLAVIALAEWVLSRRVHHSDFEVWWMLLSHAVRTGDDAASQATQSLAQMSTRNWQ